MIPAAGGVGPPDVDHREVVPGAVDHGVRRSGPDGPGVFETADRMQGAE
jgi:hypothetical protein